MFLIVNVFFRRSIFSDHRLWEVRDTPETLARNCIGIDKKKAPYGAFFLCDCFWFLLTGYKKRPLWEIGEESREEDLPTG